ncbi:type II toxin-antitoxin system RelE/ParE family toxin [Pigmentiphaga soli]|uniref:Type II toxin-antitoxin system RelE/ParE family toxin n=1 Tax=Pigmentiphaga soli TaxID=1007095 RepID=A0ABP8H212_9BURK
MARRYRLSAAAQADLIGIFAWTHRHFGASARRRYEALVIAALRDVAADPDRPGSMQRPELGDGIRSWHLRSSRRRARTGSGMVGQARHFLLYRVEDDVIVVGRVLHDAMELERYIASGQPWE